MPLAVPGTRFLCHGEQRVGDVGQKAIQVEHVDLHWADLRLLEALIGLPVQLGLADLSLQEMKSLEESVQDLAIRGLPGNGALTMML